MAEDRRAIHAYLSAESHDVWQTIADEEGISLSGFLEALAADMGEHPPEQGGHPRWDEVIRRARRVDAARRRPRRSRLTIRGAAA